MLAAQLAQLMPPTGKITVFSVIGKSFQPSLKNRTLQMPGGFWGLQRLVVPDRRTGG
jgi:hypothetical protein